MKNEEWLHESPTFESLVAEVRDERNGRRADVALIIPTREANEILMEQLKRLEKQTFTDFDIIIIYGASGKFLSQGDVHIRENGVNGGASAYYIGEKFALKEGYKTLIMADDDCLPISDNLIETLLQSIRKKGGVAIPLRKSDNVSEASRNDVIHHYGCLSSEILSDVGMTFVPFFAGGEDVELLERLRKSGYKINDADAYIIHKGFQPMAITPIKRVYYYVRGGLEAIIISKNIGRAYASILFHLETAFVYRILGLRKSSALYDAVIDGLRMDFSREKFNEKDELFEEAAPSDTIIISSENDSAGGGFLKFLSLAVGGILLFIKRSDCLGKKLMFKNLDERVHLPLLIMAKGAYVENGGKVLRLYENRSGLQIVSSILAVGLVTPFIAMLSCLLLCFGFYSKFIRRIRTTGYGVRF